MPPRTLSPSSRSFPTLLLKAWWSAFIGLLEGLLALAQVALSPGIIAEAAPLMAPLMAPLIGEAVEDDGDEDQLVLRLIVTAEAAEEEAARGESAVAAAAAEPPAWL